ncbi:TM2 domain-containing protein [Paracoccus sp. Ld10]|uniref:TM2 domain-containing protein n=1 Tax=Paracoccus sp. Ld10 TaxID=649158 RepID=UPI003867191A
MSLDTQQQILIEQRVSNDGKSPLIAYLLLIFLGWVGAHRFYLRKTGSAATMLVLWVVGLMTIAAGIGLIILAAIGIWAFVDLFLIPGMVRDHHQVLRQRLAQEMAGTATPDIRQPASALGA